MSRGFGFVAFGNAPDRNAALITMNGVMCMGNPIRVAPAAGKKGITDRGSSNTLSPTASKVVRGAGAEMQTSRMPGADPGRTTSSHTGGGSSPLPNAGCTIFVGGLNYSVTEEMLWNRFSPFGLVDYVKVSDFYTVICPLAQYQPYMCDIYRSLLEKVVGLWLSNSDEMLRRPWLLFKALLWACVSYGSCGEKHNKTRY